MTLPPKLQGALLKGMYRGDGSVHGYNDNKSCYCFLKMKLPYLPSIVFIKRFISAP